MRLRLSISVLLVVLACVPAAGAVTPAHAIGVLNAARTANALPAGIVEVPEWSAGCALHLHYQAMTHTLTHEEDPNSPYYTADGAWAGLHSVLSDGGELSTWAHNPWLFAPLHLDQLLSPFLLRTGYADGSGGICMVTLGDYPDDNAHLGEVFTYPGDGSTGAPFAVDASTELPTSPAEELGLGVTGTNLLVYARLTPYGNTRITAAALTGPDGPHEVRWLDDTSAIGGYISWGGIVVPVEPLRPGTRYTASVTVAPEDGSLPSLTHAWSFTTGLRRNEVAQMEVETRLAAPAPLELTGLSDAPGVLLTSTRAGSTTVFASARMKSSRGYFTGYLRVPLGQATICAESGGGATEYDRSRSCVGVTTHRDRQAPLLRIDYAGAKRTRVGWRLELWAYSQDNEKLPPHCSYRLGSGTWRTCGYTKTSYAIVKRPLSCRPRFRTVTFRSVDYAGNRKTATAALWIH
jgi:hypothetical protein